MTDRNVQSIRRALIATALAIAALVAFAPAAFAGLASVGSFSGAGTGDGEMTDPKRVAIHDATGNAYIVDSGNDRVQVFAPDGDSAVYLTQFGTGELDDPVGIAIDQGTGDVYVSDTAGITKFNSDGESTPAFTVDGAFADPGIVSAPLAFDQTADELVVADPADDIVKRFTTAGVATGTPFNGSTSPEGQFTGLMDVAVDSTGDVVVVDTPTGVLQDLLYNGGSRVERFDSAGAHELTYGPLDSEGAVAIDPDDGRVIVASNFHSYSYGVPFKISVFEVDGSSVSSADLPSATLYGTVGGVAAAGNGSDRVLASTSTYSWYGMVSGQVFADVAPPAVTVSPATDVAEFSATLHGNVDPQGSPSTYRFEYSVQGSGEWKSAGNQGPLETPTEVERTLVDLAPGTTYVARLVATNPGGSVTTAEESFTTLPADPPAVTIEPAAGVSGDGAMLAGAVDPQGHPSRYHFEYRRDVDADWKQVFGGTGDAGQGDDPVSVSAELDDLDSLTDYRYRLVAGNGAGETLSSEEAFTTTASAPVAQTQKAVDRDDTSAKLIGRVDPRGAPTDYWFEYGTDTSYGSRFPALGEEVDAGSGSLFVDVEQTVAGLQAGATYHYRLVARNATGTTLGDDRTVTTAGGVAEPCTNAAVRRQQDAEFLPYCRAYEQVSPVDKNGYGVNYFPTQFGARGINMSISAMAQDGGVALFHSSGSLGGSDNGLIQTYFSRRGEAGWVTKSVSSAPTVPNPEGGSGRAVWWRATPDLSKGLIHTNNAWSPDDHNLPPVPAEDPAGYDVYMRHVDGGNELMSVAPDGSAAGNSYTVDSSYAMSSDGQRVFFTTSSTLVPEDTSPAPDIYERSNGETQLVSAGPEGGVASDCGSGFNTAQGVHHVADENLSDDGRVVVFQTPHQFNLSCGRPRVFVRIDGERTIEVSASRRAPADPNGPGSSEFVTMSDDGERILIRSDERLTNDAPQTPPSEGSPSYLYEFRTDTEQLVYTGLKGINAGGVVAASADAKRVYFVTSSALTPDATANGEKLYRWQAGRVERLATDPGSNLSSSLREINGQTVFSRDGSTLLFRSFGDLGVGNDGGRAQVYVVGDDTPLRCLSCPPDSVTPASDARFVLGNGDQSVAQRGTFASAISADGSRVVFDTADPLVSHDVNGRRDVYEWYDGELSLLTPGTGDFNAHVFGVSNDGHEVMITTGEALLEQDIDGGDLDIYNLRMGGGFLKDVPPVDIPPCSGDACQGETVPPPAERGLGSGSLEGKGNVVSPRGAGLAVSRPGSRALARAVRTGVVRVRVRVPRPGRISGTARARVPGKSGRPVLRKVGGGSKTVRRAGLTVLTIKLDRVARGRLEETGRLALRIQVRAGGAKRTLGLALRRAGR